MLLVLLDVLKLALAVFMGFFVGHERKRHGKPVGMRTLSIVCAGSTFITIISHNLFPSETARILAGIITGIGFLGAGSIIAEGNHIKGLTTSATIWAMALVGVGVGLGEYLLSAVAAGLFYAILEIDER